MITHLWPWASAHILEILVFLATAIEAGALVFIYKLDKRQLQLEEGRTLVDLRVDVEFAAGKDEGNPDIWIENAAAGSCYIEEVVFVATCPKTGKGSERKCYIGGNRSLAGFGSVKVDSRVALQQVANDVWGGEALRLGILLVAQARVSTGRGRPIPKSSRAYATLISRAGDLFGLTPMQPLQQIEGVEV